MMDNWLVILELVILTIVFIFMLHLFRKSEEQEGKIKHLEEIRKQTVSAERVGETESEDKNGK